ncbi:MAG: histidinol-phosphatase HisJ family protein [Solobacterium sp.]|jgi:histidinol-phosphatase (PHP family)|nr:histidinol-phosphatase HisJ family protein [Solobacterium sp.]MCH4206631.1 histidinol-phosphatase HisJ family protein [Solobacterium sp.]MCH4228051.1 histidinol-phosphatase HisJ family protein [Solobacterium sp.]MCH4282614.1 histidinol-phosphatase HisJ family protein [Solobacterium sp.]
MLADYHLHCEFSSDSQEPMENQIERGIALHLNEMCFTDHADYGTKRDWDDPRGIDYCPADPYMNNDPDDKEPLANVDYPAYFKKLAEMQKKYSSQITIKKGLEFGIQTGTIPEFEKLFAKVQDHLDFVLLSMHQVDNKGLWNNEFQEGRSQKEYNDLYYEEIYKVQQSFKHYAVLAHLDLLVRYDPAGIYPFEKEKDIIAAILKQAIQDHKGIEINTSSWHYGLKDTQPSRAILKLYKDLGGRIITMGSDAHSTKYVADHFDDAKKILKEEIGFKEFCTFDHMEPIFHAL